ncbi:hypothetical protein [Roseovarius sp. MMSF_3350]|uniref:hypothetical protein n=1 Tax=Roseovarius sp. MMSF_3350 TaxID=3046706 RepID=UPI00273F4798|nr:hypothetical protein [Roseovarius sp. MMSF_3350]
MTVAPQHFDRMPRPQQAGILANDIRFKRFVAVRLHLAREGAGTITVNTSAAAEFIRSECQVASRRDLATDTAAAQRFDALRTEFDAFTGRIARPERI